MRIFVDIDTERKTVRFTDEQSTFCCLVPSVNFSFLTIQEIIDDAEMMTEAAEED